MPMIDPDAHTDAVMGSVDKVNHLLVAEAEAAVANGSATNVAAHMMTVVSFSFGKLLAACAYATGENLETGIRRGQASLQMAAHAQAILMAPEETEKGAA